MGKRYLKRLWNTFSFALGYIVMLFFIGFLSHLVIFSILPLQKIIPEDILTIILAGIALILMLVFLYRTRCSDKPTKREYLEGIEYKPLPFFKDFWQTLKSKDNLAHTLAFLTLDFLVAVPVGISASSNIWIFLVGMLIQLLVEGTVFILINTFIWSLAHRRWSDYWRYAGYVTDRFEK